MITFYSEIIFDAHSSRKHCHVVCRLLLTINTIASLSPGTQKKSNCACGLYAEKRSFELGTSPRSDVESFRGTAVRVETYQVYMQYD